MVRMTHPKTRGRVRVKASLKSAEPRSSVNREKLDPFRGGSAAASRMAELASRHQRRLATREPTLRREEPSLAGMRAGFL